MEMTYEVELRFCLKEEYRYFDTWEDVERCVSEAHRDGWCTNFDWIFTD